MLTRVLSKIDGRYPTTKERAEIESYLATALARREALEEVRQRAVRVVDDVMAGIRRLYPQFSKHRPQGFDKGHRDMVQLTNMTANAMFLGETETIDDMFTHWYKSILKSVHLSPQFLDDTYRLWLQSLRTNLTPPTFALIRPFAEHMSSSLSSVPDPAIDEVGPRRPSL